MPGSGLARYGGGLGLFGGGYLGFTTGGASGLLGFYGAGLFNCLSGSAVDSNNGFLDPGTSSVVSRGLVGRFPCLGVIFGLCRAFPSV